MTEYDTIVSIGALNILTNGSNAFDSAKACTPNGFWKNIDNQKRYAVWLGETLVYTKMEHWYNITRKLLTTYGGIGLIGNYYSTSHSRFLQTVFPDFKWDLSKFTKKYSNGQIELLEYLKVSIPTQLDRMKGGRVSSLPVDDMKDFLEKNVTYS